MKVQYVNAKPVDMDDTILYPVITLGNVYKVIEVDDFDYLVIGYVGKPYYIHKSRFEVIDESWDDDWIEMIDEDDGGRVVGPAFINEVGFMERYHDYKKKEIEKFTNYMLEKFRKEVGMLEGIEFLPTQIKYNSQT